MISITADRIKTAGVVGTAFLSLARGITVYGNKLLALYAAGYYTLWQTIEYSLLTIFGAFVPGGVASLIYSAMTGGLAYKTMDYYSLATWFGQLVISFVPGTTWLKIALNMPKIIGAW